MRRTFLCLMILAGLLHPIGPAQAEGITFNALSATYQFAEQITFTAEVSGPSPITRATVFFQSGSQPPYSHPADPFTPATPITLTATIDLTETKLIPFSTVSYWWEVADASGNAARSETQTLRYVDNRFVWQDLTAGPVRVHWYQGDSGFSSAAASAASEALPKIQQQIGVEPPSPLDVYVYASTDDLRSAVELAGRAWLGGQARPELGVVLVAIPPGDSARLQMRRDIPHELTHLMTFVATTGDTGKFTYSVDGVPVNKAVQRQPLTLDNYNGTYESIEILHVTDCSNPAANGDYTNRHTVRITSRPTASWNAPARGSNV